MITPDPEIEELARAVEAALAKESTVTIANSEAVRGAVRSILRRLNAEEKAIEVEAEKLLRSRGREIVQQGADFNRMLDEAKRILAKQKGFPL